MVIFIPDDEGSSEEDTADKGSAEEGSSEEDTVETSSTDSLVLGEDSLMSQCCITVQHATRISHVISGFLLSSTTKCFAFARDKVVEYAEFLSIEKQIQTFHIVKVFGRICNMSTFLYLEDDERNTRVRKDVAVLTTDAGKLIILKYQKLLDFDSKLLQKRKSEQKLFEKIVYPFCEPGYNAQFPGHFLTTDPRGCAILIGAILDKMIVFIKTKSEGDPLKNLSVFVIDYGGYVIYDMVGLKPKNKLFQFAILRSKYTMTIN
ncbi:splicing factor 3B subunit 3 isoform X2 [Parasteatoda tepidariorum]|uniref:splicing factor 3B subunit 3 isoform X2 n=1 Tax=Parasteatoda tepidariorum TaxID=114398 RepID=UPI001C727C4C|nr:splicing factor 3B subunit 3-like isoform X2 [Parasteatoda tepidariorum]